MPVATRSNFAREYADWLRDRVTSVEQGGRQVISTPFLDPFHDGIRVYVEPHNGEFTYTMMVTPSRTSPIPV